MAVHGQRRMQDSATSRIRRLASRGRDHHSFVPYLRATPGQRAMAAELPQAGHRERQAPGHSARPRTTRPMVRLILQGGAPSPVTIDCSPLATWQLRGRCAGQRRVRIDLHTTRSLKRSSRPWSSMQRCPLFRPCSVRHRSAPPNVANQRILKSQLNGMIAGPMASSQSSSRTSAERALLTLQCQQQGRQYEAIYHDRNMIACSAR